MDFKLIKSVSAIKKIKLEDLATLANIKRATFFNYLSGKTAMPADVLKKLSDILEIPIARLYDESNNIESYELSEPTTAYVAGKNVKEIPLVHKFAYGNYTSARNNEKYLKSLPKYPVLINQPFEGNYLCFEVSGDSMWDGTHESRLAGDIILTREIQKEQWQAGLDSFNNNFVVVNQKEGVLIKRIAAHNTEYGTITLRSLNTQYEDLEFVLSDVLIIFAEVKLVSRD